DFPQGVAQLCPFSLPVSPGRYTVTFTAGDATEERILSVGTGETTRLDIALEPSEARSGFSFGIRALGGIANPFGDATVVDNTDISAAMKVAAHFPFRQETTSFEFGIYARMGFADSIGVLGGATVGYLIPLGVVDLSIAGGLG